MKESINFAREFERDGAIFYIEMGMKADNIITKKLFYTITRQEIEHLEAIDSFIINGLHRNYEDSGEKVEIEMRDFFKKLKAKGVSESHLQAYETAIDMEKRSYQLYERFYHEAKNDEERNFFNFLMSEEKKHLDAFVNVYSYLSDTDDWFQQEESKVWNWMNI
ncbi:MAG: DUF2202 domain-containing protein [Elusimicrobia bacterium]|nr:DUF2202 domain-containing protein [Elusimicrobiota bacterium]